MNTGRSNGTATKSKFEVRNEVINYIRNERDTILRKWMALREQVHAEDRRKEEFADRMHKHKNKLLPLNVVKFIGSLRKSVHHTIRHKGGTAYSIVRALFIYWDASKMGLISAKDLESCMKSLQIEVSYDQCLEIVRYYNGNHGDTMSYQQLLLDLQQDEPSMLAYVEQHDEEERDNAEPQFDTIADRFAIKPEIVVNFVNAFRHYVNKLLRSEGGTPEQHVRWLFTFFDYNFSGGLNVDDLMRASKRKLKFKMSRDQAVEIVKYYDRKFNGDIDYHALLNDVCADVKPIMQFSELTFTARMREQHMIRTNPLLPVPFAAPKSKVLEKFKHDCGIALVNKVSKHGGSIASWIREAFVFFDPQYTRKISRVEDLVGAAKRIGVDITANDASSLISCYDVLKTGEMHYEYLAKEIIKDGGSFLTEGKLVDADATATSRMPSEVREFEQNVKKAVDAFVRKSKGKLVARDVFRGSFARFDSSKTGHVDFMGFKNAVEALCFQISSANARLVLDWFDTDGTHLLNYNEMTKQFYGGDVSTDDVVLPQLRASKSTAAVSRAPGIQGYGVKQTTLEKNLEVIESPAVKLARFKINKNKILAEKNRVERKLAVIEEQRKAIIEDYKVQRGKA
jgi:Ca2+-binding EF-hand superfamily protein